MDRKQEDAWTVRQAGSGGRAKRATHLGKPPSQSPDGGHAGKGLHRTDRWMDGGREAGQGFEKVWVGVGVRLRPEWWQSQVRRGRILGVWEGGAAGRRLGQETCGGSQALPSALCCWSGHCTSVSAAGLTVEPCNP